MHRIRNHCPSAAGNIYLSAGTMVAAHGHWQDCCLRLATRLSQRQQLPRTKHSSSTLPKGFSHMPALLDAVRLPARIGQERHCPCTFWAHTSLLEGVLLGHSVDVWQASWVPHLICYEGVSLFVAKPPTGNLAIFRVTWDWTPPFTLLGCCYHLFPSPPFSPCSWSTCAFPPGTPRPSSASVLFLLSLTK